MQHGYPSDRFRTLMFTDTHTSISTRASRDPALVTNAPSAKQPPQLGTRRLWWLVIVLAFLLAACGPSKAEQAKTNFCKDVTNYHKQLSTTPDTSNPAQIKKYFGTLTQSGHKLGVTAPKKIAQEANKLAQGFQQAQAVLERNNFDVARLSDQDRQALDDTHLEDAVRNVNDFTEKFCGPASKPHPAKTKAP